MGCAYMSEEEQNRLLAKAISDYGQAVKDLESCRSRAEEIRGGIRTVEHKIETALTGRTVIQVGRRSSEVYPTKDEVELLLKNFEGAKRRVKQLAEQVRRMGGAPDLSIADELK